MDLPQAPQVRIFGKNCPGFAKNHGVLLFILLFPVLISVEDGDIIDIPRILGKISIFHMMPSI